MQDRLDILLIFPQIGINERYSRNVGSVGGHIPPLGLASLAAYIREKGFKVGILDAAVEGLSEKTVARKVVESRPRAVGFSSITSNFHRAAITAGLVKAKCPDILVMLGGPHASVVPGKVLEDHGCFDVVVKGEGELTLTEIMDRFREDAWNLALLRKRLGSVKGIYYRKKNKILSTGEREHIKDLDDLPFPARDLLPMEKYRPLPHQYKRLPVFHMFVIRGCPFNCSFCSNNAVFGRKIRARSVAKVIAEMKHLKETYGVREIMFFEDIMTSDKKWMHEFCSLMIETKLDIVWSCYSRVDTITEEMLKHMKKAGCWNILFGYESGDQSLLDNIGKRITIAQIETANRLCKQVGIEIRASFILGLPGETPKLARKTIEFAKKLNPDYVQFCIATPFPGTRLHEEAERYGALQEDFSKYTTWNPVFVPKGYGSREQILALEKKAMREFYLRPGYILEKIWKIRSLEDAIRYGKGLRLVLGFSR
jgi:anaerobic magnesium-protoporphyrin IX monomethyl ester cyclase